LKKSKEIKKQIFTKHLFYAYVLHNLLLFCRFSDTSSSAENLSQVPSLLQNYKSCLATRKFGEAKKTNKEIHYFIINEITITARELWSFAEDLLKKADCFEESIPAYFAAASLFEKEGNLWRMCECVGGILRRGMHRANMGMIERDVTMKEVVKRHVIPLMHYVKNQMLEVTSESMEDKCKWMWEVLFCIAQSEKLVGDYEAAEEACKEYEVWGKRRREEERRKPWWKKIMDVL